METRGQGELGWLLELLEKRWQEMARAMGPEWEGFVRAFREEVEALPSHPTPEALEGFRRGLRRLMEGHPYTRGLLEEPKRDLEEPKRDGLLGGERLLDPAAAGTAQLEVGEIENRFRRLVETWEREKERDEERGEDGTPPS
jgi:HAMP domain-containing protein